jgi:hypothetical protein
MWDNLTALQPSTVKEAQTVLFLRKLPRHIRNLINPRAFKEPEDLIQRCNEIWEDRPRKRPPQPRPPRGLTLLSEAPAALPLRSAGKGLSQQVWPPPFAHPEAVQRRPQ